MMLPAGLKPEQPAGCGRGGVMGEGAVGCLLLQAAVRCPWVHPHLFEDALEADASQPQLSRVPEWVCSMMGQGGERD